MSELTYKDYYDGACFLAECAYKGLKDLAGEPYIEHAKRVASKFNEYTYKTIAILHDVLEDTWVTEEMLSKMFPEDIVKAVVYLTRKDNESYKEYIERMCEPREDYTDESSYYAREVKIADLEDNMNLSRLINITDEDFNRVKKYAKWKKFLIEQQKQTNSFFGIGRRTN